MISVADKPGDVAEVTVDSVSSLSRDELETLYTDMSSTLENAEQYRDALAKMLRGIDRELANIKQAIGINCDKALFDLFTTHQIEADNIRVEQLRKDYRDRDKTRDNIEKIYANTIKIIELAKSNLVIITETMCKLNCQSQHN